MPAEGSQAALEVVDLSKRYEDTLALNKLTFRVMPGEVLGMVGPNGAGKTTALRTIAGVLPAQSGVVRILGHDIATDEVAAKARMAWVPDDPQPFDTLTVEEHLAFTARLYGLSDWRDRADELLTTFELAEKRKALGGELSRGMRQKLAFMCAWLPRPAVVLLDEPLSGLDPRGIRSARTAIQRLAEEGSAVILSSHQLELIEALASRLLILDRGERVFVGTLDEARAMLAPDPSTSLEEVFFAATGDRETAARAAAAVEKGEAEVPVEPFRDLAERAEADER